MKKKNLQLKLNLKKQTVLDLSSQNKVNGGRPDTGTIVSNDCQRTVVNCPTQGHASQCCPGCRSGCNATMVKELCEIVLESVNNTVCMDPFIG